MKNRNSQFTQALVEARLSVILSAMDDSVSHSDGYRNIEIPVRLADRIKVFIPSDKIPRQLMYVSVNWRIGRNKEINEENSFSEMKHHSR